MRTNIFIAVIIVYVCVCFTKAQSGSVFKTIIRNGTGPVPMRNQSVIVHYTGKLQNGEVFDSSRDRNEPFTFKLGMQEVISGWDAGISSMKVGERAEIEIPPEYAYGAEGYPPVIPASATLIFDIELLGIEGVTDQQPPAPVQVMTQPAQTFGAASFAGAQSGGVSQFSSANFAPQSIPASQPAQSFGAASFATQGASSGGVSQVSTANFAPQSLPTDFQGFSSISQFPPVNSGASPQGFSGAATSASSFGSAPQGVSSGFPAQTGPSFTQPQPQRELPRTISFTAPEPPRPQQPSGFGTIQFGSQSQSMFPSSSIGLGQPSVGSFTGPEPQRPQQPSGFGTMQFSSQSTFPSSSFGSGQPPVVSPPQSSWNPPPSSSGGSFRPQSFAPPSSPQVGFDARSRSSGFDFQGSRFGQSERFGREPTSFQPSQTGPGFPGGVTASTETGFPLDRGFNNPTDPRFPVDRGMVSPSGPGMGAPGQPGTFGRFGPSTDFTAAGGDFTDFRSSFEMPPFAGSSSMPGMWPSDRLGTPEGAMLGFDSRRDPRFDMAGRVRPGFGSTPARFGGPDMPVGGPDMRIGMPPMRGGAPFMTPVRSPFRRLIRRRSAGVL